MSRIAAIAPADAQGHARELLDGIQRGLGVVPNLYRVTAQAPTVLEGLRNLNATLADGTLNTKLREQIALTIAERNGCDYCLSAHSFLGNKAGLSDADMEQARGARAVDAKVEAALRFALRVVDQTGRVSDADLNAVRAAGFSDGQIIELVGQVVLNIFTNLLNHVAQTEIDFPKVSATRPHAA